jgi:hypothetical protein
MDVWSVREMTEEEKTEYDNQKKKLEEFFVTQT